MFEFHRFNDPSHSNNLEAISFPGDGNSATMQQRKSTFDCIRLDFQSKSSPYCTGRVEMTFFKKIGRIGSDRSIAVAAAGIEQSKRP